MPIAKKTDIPQDFLNQMKTNLKKETSSADEPSYQTPVATVVSESKVETVPNPVEAKKDKYADVMNVRLSKGRRNEIKAFCTNCGISVTQYIESSFEFLAKEVAEGRIVISKGGISKI